MESREGGSTKFIISATDAKSRAESTNNTLLSLLPTLLPSSKPLARPPISNYHVAAVGLSSDHRIFVGVNLEFPNLPLHHSVHAEQFLISSLSSHGGGRLLAVAVSSAPCGHCRQFLQETRHASSLRIRVVDDVAADVDDVAADVEYGTLAGMLPSPFGPFDLLDGGAPLLLEPIHNGLYLMGPAISTSHEPIMVSPLAVTGNSENGPIDGLENGPHVYDRINLEKIYSQNANSSLNGSCIRQCEPNFLQLEIGALEAANRSHAPYSNCPSGVALMDREGKIYKGSYTESAAYNPSLGPVQAAVVAYVAGGGGEYNDIVAGVLVEREGAIVRQDETAKLLLKSISPKCELRVIHCRSE